MKFFLGTHMIARDWWEAEIPLFISRRRLLKPADRNRVLPLESRNARRVWDEAQRRELKTRLPRAKVGWALDSGGFTELDLFGGWQTTEEQYVHDVQRIEQEMGHLEWVAPQDWMCERFMLEKTGLTVEEHQHRTIRSFLSLREQIGTLVVPVLQGYLLDEYLRCWEMYDRAGVDLELEPTVGLGSVCRRQNTTEAGTIIRRLQPLRLHGFGVKLTGLESYGDVLHSADSMAWSYRARRDHPLPGCTHKSCSNCLRWASRWYREFVQRQGQLRLDVDRKEELATCVA